MRRAWWLSLLGVLSCGPRAVRGEAGIDVPAMTVELPGDEDACDDCSDGDESDLGCEDDAASSCMPVDRGCLIDEVCGDGLDNDCNGRVDEGCSCMPGAVQRCFAGPPGRRGVGVCSDGTQVCEGTGTSGTWGSCRGGVVPSAESCNGADDDCDGCIESAACCDPRVRCPGHGDPRVPAGRPYETYVLDGSTFFFGTARAYHWHVEGGACDQLAWATTRRVSYTLNGHRTATLVDVDDNTLRLSPTLSGDYTVTLSIEPDSGPPARCTFVVPVRAPGLRAELCWDRTGETDLDLWLHNPRNHHDWADVTNDDTCAYYNCRNARAATSGVPLDWGYAASVTGSCREPLPGGACNNPRLDVDNVSTLGTPENINLDAPRDGEVFRIAANYYGGTGPVQPIVNVFCGGELRASLGGARVGTVGFGGTPVSGVIASGANDSGSLWRVADVTMHEPGDTCDVTALVGGDGAACVLSDGDRSYAGACRAVGR